MATKTNNIRIGIFVLVGIFLLIAGLLAFGAKSYFTKKFKFETAIEGEVSGLAVGSQVTFRGVPVGKVSNIDFAPNIYPNSTSRVIVVEFEAERPIYVMRQSPEQREQTRKDEIAKGLRAMVKAQGITGTSILALEQLDPERHPPPVIDYTPRYPYIPSAPGQFTRMLESIEQTLGQLQTLDFKKIAVSATNTLGHATDLLKKLERLDLETTVGKANKLVDHLDVTVGEIGDALKSMKLDRLGRNADELLVGLQESNTKLQTVLDNVGTVPLDKTLNDIRTAVQRLDDVLLQLKAYPSGFIFGKPPEPAQSVESPK